MDIAVAPRREWYVRENKEKKVVAQSVEEKKALFVSYFGAPSSTGSMEDLSVKHDLILYGDKNHE